MNLRKLSYGLVIAAASMASFNSYASDSRFFEERTKMLEMKTVSKAQFLEMAGKMFEMKAKEMGAKDMKMTQAQMIDFLKDFYIPGR